MQCMSLHRSAKWAGVWTLLAGLLLLAGCSSRGGAEGSLSVSPVSTPMPVPSSTPSVAPTPVAGPVRLVVLHTNDNWGETEPCG